MYKKEDGLIPEAISHQNNYTISDQADKKRLNRAKAIRLKCLDCCGYQPLEVRECTSYDCPLWRYRMGREERDDLYYLAHANTI